MLLGAFVSDIKFLVFLWLEIFFKNKFMSPLIFQDLFSFHFLYYKFRSVPMFTVTSSVVNICGSEGQAPQNEWNGRLAWQKKTRHAKASKWMKTGNRRENYRGESYGHSHATLTSTAARFFGDFSVPLRFLSLPLPH